MSDIKENNEEEQQEEEDDEMRYYKVACKNIAYVTVEAKNEDDAKALVEAEIEKDYDYPWNEADDYDGWEITEEREQ
tara:strand:- start:306 stop:536 length:231 start_codon:yes stop_codon:yes gene_type:complete